VSAWAAADGGVRLMVRVTPRGGRDAIDGLRRDADGRAALAVRVCAAPADGAANESLIRLIARAARLAPGAVTIMRGESGRNKQVWLAGDPDRIASALSEAVR
jgi:hypothetical protein